MDAGFIKYENVYGKQRPRISKKKTQLNKNNNVEDNYLLAINSITYLQWLSKCGMLFHGLTDNPIEFNKKLRHRPMNI